MTKNTLLFARIWGTFKLREWWEHLLNSQTNHHFVALSECRQWTLALIHTMFTEYNQHSASVFFKNTACLFKTVTGEVNLPWRTLTQLAGWTHRCIAGSGSGAWLWKNEAARTLQKKAQHYNSSTDVSCNAPYRLQTSTERNSSRPGRISWFCCIYPSQHIYSLW